MGDQREVFGVKPEKYVIAPGATNAQLITPVAYEVANQVKYGTGGSLEIQKAPQGTTYIGASLAPLIGTGYLMGTAEALSLGGPARYYLMATGATVTAFVLRGLSDGYDGNLT